MKKILIAAMGILCASALLVNAQDTNTTSKISKKKLTAEQKALQKEMLAKYDTDKNGKLSKSEISKMSKEDHDKMLKAGLLKTSKKSTGANTPAPATPPTPAAPAPAQ